MCMCCTVWMIVLMSEKPHSYHEKRKKPKLLILIEVLTLAQCFKDFAEICNHTELDGIILKGNSGNGNIHAGINKSYGNIFDVADMLYDRCNDKRIKASTNKKHDGEYNNIGVEWYYPKQLIFGVKSLATDADTLSIASKHKIDILLTSFNQIQEVKTKENLKLVPQIISNTDFVYPTGLRDNTEYAVIDIHLWKKVHFKYAMSIIAEAAAVDSVYQR